MTNETTKFAEGARKVIHLGQFHCDVDADALTALPVGDFHDVDEARAELEPFLDAISLRSELLQRKLLSFRWGGATTVDTENGSQRIGVTAAMEVSSAMSVTAVVTRSRITLPVGEPLHDLTEATRLLNRWRDFVNGRERLLVTGYWILTELERYYGSRKKAARHLAVEQSVLNNMGRLTARNDPEHGRKAAGPEERLAEAEVAWLRDVLPVVILRVAEVESGVNVDQWTMAALPSLGT